jgi:Ran GTPase-activating protein (RanGAP) involved in mRNA processing and transport
MTSLSEAYVNYCISTEGLELDNNLAEVFTQADIELLEGSFNLSFSSRSKTVMDDEMINHLFNILGKTVKDMEILSLKYLPITDIGCSKIATMIKEMTSLKTLDLTSCEINNKGVIDIMHALPLSNMKCLILSGNKLEPECCKIIGEKLSLSHLEALEVADCGLRIFFIGNAFEFFSND